MSDKRAPKAVVGEWACGKLCGYQGLRESFEQTDADGNEILVCPSCKLSDDIFPTDDNGWPGQVHGEETEEDD